jgi:ABC-type Fe3+/spermidine/putrescine transport system ATPase subunit
MSTATTILELRNVEKRFDGVTAVADCTLQIAAGEFVTLLGPSGCGKTTTLRLIAGFLTPDAGEILFDGDVISSPGFQLAPERRNMGMVFQSYAIWPHMSVLENVTLPLRVRRMARQEIDRRAREMLRLCRLDRLEGRSPHQLSGGQLQRVALARALAYNPRLVLLDEPLSNLDAALREEVRKELRAIHQEIRTTFVLVTHDQSEAMLLSDRVVVMNAGRVEQVGTPEEVYGSPRTEFVARFVGGVNLLRGQVEQTQEDGGQVTARIKAVGLELTVQRKQRLATQTECQIAIHPESIVVARANGQAPAGENAFRGIVKDAYFVGRTHELMIDIRGVNLRAIHMGKERFSAGNEVRVTIPAHGVIIF